MTQGGSAIQFYGAENVLQAFSNRDVEVWAIFCGKQFINKGKGAEDLRTFLEAISQGGTNAVYTLKVYEEFDSPTQVKEKTDCDGSFNFRLNDPQQGVTTGQYRAFINQTNLEERLQRIEEMLLKEETESDQEEEKSIGAVLTEAIADPVKLNQWIGVIQNVIGTLSGKQKVMQPAMIGNPEPANSGPDLEKLQQSLDTLGRNDPGIIDHLDKLARISEINKPMFNTLISMLDSMQV